ncbi:hypothetical protein AVEN_42486-1 [Araneus ventricosus]|uniref:Uncharacterized protein n=1 Tax=Araneus ventricosus TaxID=182803 RepID=A0A4Y2TRP3_ARAVE|nr:hypothetical protein AVEN_42486-1 [Araneus ventricosus]
MLVPSVHHNLAILFTIMVKYHVIKYHKKPSPRPALGPRPTLNDRPPRLHRALGPPHNSPHYELLMRRPVIGLGSKCHTTITVSTKGGRTCLLIRQLLLREHHAGTM